MFTFLALFLGGFFEFFEFGFDAEAIGFGHPVEDENAVEVVGFVLPASGEEAGGSLGDALAGEIGVGYCDDWWPEDICEDSREAEAAFFTEFFESLGL